MACAICHTRHLTACRVFYHLGRGYFVNAKITSQHTTFLLTSCPSALSLFASGGEIHRIKALALVSLLGMVETPRLEAKKKLPMFPKGRGLFFLCSRGHIKRYMAVSTGRKSRIHAMGTVKPLDLQSRSVELFFVNYHCLKAVLSSFFL